MGLQGPRTAEWYQRARGSLVAGVSSGFRYWGPDDTMVIDHGEGAHVFDMDGKRYIDYQLGFGPVVLGHGRPEVVAAAAEAAASGTVFAMTSAREIVAAEAVLSAIEWADGMRFTNTGTEATMHALRLARAHTGRDLVVKFEGTYHGAHDYLLFTTAGAPSSHLGSRRSPVPWQQSSGIPEVIRSLIRVAPFNDLEAVEKLFRREGQLIAAMIVEPTLGNSFGIMPAPGFLEGLRRICDEYGTVLIFDEVKTGFRLAYGGAAGLFGVTPDLGTYAKSIANGFPIAAIAGRSEVIQAWAEGGVMQAGTYSGNSIGSAAVAATLGIMKSGEPFAAMEKSGTALMNGLQRILAEEGVPGHVIGHPAMFSIFLGEDEPRDFRDSGGHDDDLYGRVIMGMIRRGVMPCDDAREPWFISSAHTQEDVAITLEAFGDALQEAKG